MELDKVIRRPFLDVKNLVIGCVLNNFFIINFFASGYILKCVKLTLDGNYDLPEWDNWGDMFLGGFFQFLIGLIWLIPALFFISIYILMVVLAMLASGGNQPELFMGFTAVISLIGFVLLFLTLYILPAAIVRFVDKDNFGAAFEFIAIIKKSLTLKYFVAWILSCIIVLIVIIIIGLLIGLIIMSVVSGAIFIGPVGILISVLFKSVSYVGRMMIMTLFAEAYRG
ncbi:DUF4013 domain-containing protein [archaeon]|jgi:hypothetical protein|nr:DUF4013 domain-containing protein [archaeon]MBT4417183.1 DUF4013 domain-containing protein [archaeon]